MVSLFFASSRLRRLSQFPENSLDDDEGDE
jgi:hypothetical protein